MPPEDPREKRGRDGLWKVPPPWEPAAKPARSHRGLEAFGFHTFHSPDGGLTYKPLTQGVGPFYSIGVGSFYVVKAKRSRSTFVQMKEEQIRDLILVNLNGHYEGDATGETFNAQGKTDILIRADDRNVFIAECKFWAGPKSLLAAIDQILGYLTWRDTKAALLLFCKNIDFTNTLSSIATAVPEHPNFKRELKTISDTHVRYLFRQKDDPVRDLYLAVQAFYIPK